MNREKIKQILPHRSPFLMLDSADIISPKEEGVGYKELTGKEYFFEGHFPGHMVMPGVLIVETIAQIAMLILGRGDLKLKGIEKVKFRQTIEPGDRLEVRVKKTLEEAGDFRFFGEIYLGENLAASGEILLSSRC
ncbi:MAG: 3-hydroxyacyl-[acyl-carrier-protein] dehydratase FabZ [Elusimicrobia bacterium]|nr:3-hydroxyacyl-[acyl-carrier-protein] dehydratase FabZ [Elusimicrobiota bacterium]